MRTTDELFADKAEWASFHDVVFEVTGRTHTPTQLRILFGALPERIRDTAHSWGLSDTCFRDDASVFMREKLEGSPFAKDAVLHIHTGTTDGPKSTFNPESTP